MKKIFFLNVIILIVLFESFGQSDYLKFITNNCVLRNISFEKTNDSCYLIYTTTNDSLDNLKKDHRPDVNHIDFLALKVNNSGKILWEKRFRDNKSWDHSTEIIKSKDNFIYLTGLKQQNDGKWFLKLIKLDPNGNTYFLDTTYLLGDYRKSNIRYSLSIDHDDNLVCFYLINDSINKLNYDNLYMRKIKENGEQIFAKKIETKLVYQSQFRFIKNMCDRNFFYIMTLKETPQIKYDSINEIRIGFNDMERYEILKINSEGKIYEVIDLPVQNELDVKFYNDKKQFIGFSSNYFSGDKFINSFNPSTPGYWLRMDSSYLSLKIFNNNFQKEILIKKFKLDYTKDMRMINSTSNIIKGSDSCYVFLYKYELSDSSYYHFVKTDLNGNIILDKEIKIDPYSIIGEVSVQAEINGYTIIGGLRKIDEKYKQHLRNLFMMKLDLNGNIKTF